MTQDELEFLIVQHVDGTLSPDETPRLEAALARDPAARELLAEHRRLATALRAGPAVEVDHAWLSAQIASRLDDVDRHAGHSFKLPRWMLFAPMAAAAGLLVTLTLGVVFHRDDGDPIPTPRVAPVPAVQVASVTGPTAERSDAPQTVAVSVGAPANLSASMVTALFLAEQFPGQGRVIVRPAGPAHPSTFE